MTHLFILSASTYITFRTYNTKLFMCGDFCPIPGHNTDAKYNKLAPDLNILNKFIFLRQIYFTYNIHT